MNQTQQEKHPLNQNFKKLLTKNTITDRHKQSKRNIARETYLLCRAISIY
jgi:hypothetical protein